MDTCFNSDAEQQAYIGDMLTFHLLRASGGLVQYGNRYVAVHGGEIIGYDAGELNLTRRMTEKYEFFFVGNAAGAEEIVLDFPEDTTCGRAYKRS